MIEQQSNRSIRFFARYALNRVSTVKACRECGRVSIMPNGEERTLGAVGVRAVEREGGRITSGYAGLSTCGRIWLCPVCNSKVMALRALELGKVLMWAEANGYRVIWGSLTAWHRRGNSLRWLIDIQRDAWRSVVNSKTWRAYKDLRVGYVRAAELTVGANGWHPHFHPIIIVKGSEESAGRFADWLVSAWVDGVNSAGGKAVTRNAQQLRVLSVGDFGAELANYVTKSVYTPSQKLALETVWSQSKDGRGRVKSTEPHWSLLDGAGKGIADDVFNWWELEEATHGHRMLTWSRDLRKLAGLGVEKTDEAVAALELGSVEDTVCYITAEGWATVRESPAVQAGILDVLEQSGWVALRAYLDLHGVEWFTADQIGGGGVVQLVKSVTPVERPRPYMDPELVSRFLKFGDNPSVAQSELSSAGE